MRSALLIVGLIAATIAAGPPREHPPHLGNLDAPTAPSRACHPGPSAHALNFTPGLAVGTMMLSANAAARSATFDSLTPYPPCVWVLYQRPDGSVGDSLWCPPNTKHPVFLRPKSSRQRARGS